MCTSLPVIRTSLGSPRKQLWWPGRAHAAAFMLMPLSRDSTLLNRPVWCLQEQQRKLGLCLEALGERAERIAALEADVAEMRLVFRGALEDAVSQLAQARAGAAGTPAAAAADSTASTAADAPKG